MTKSVLSLSKNIWWEEAASALTKSVQKLIDVTCKNKQTVKDLLVYTEMLQKFFWGQKKKNELLNVFNIFISRSSN